MMVRAAAAAAAPSAGGGKEGPGILIRTLESGASSCSSTNATKPQRGDIVLVEYQGRLEDGTPFCSSSATCPMLVAIGSKDVMEGWQVALPLLELNQLAEITIPHLYGYGELGYPPKVPPRATLIFKMRILEIDDSKRKEMNRPWWRRWLFFFL